MEVALAFCCCTSIFASCAMMSPNWPLTSMSLSDAAFELSRLALSCACVAARRYCALRTLSSAFPPPDSKFGSGRKAFELRSDEPSLRSASHANATTSSRHAETSLVSCSMVLRLPGGTTELSLLASYEMMRYVSNAIRK